VKAGEHIGSYRIERRLGEGGVGEVFEAVDEILERRVAIKRLRPELAANPSLVERFRAEAQALARLGHPNIATLYALEPGAGAMCMVMEYVEGETVSTLLRERGPLPLEDALRLALQALDGIGFAHARGVIHRDLKGSNLMVDPHGTLKLMDFGIARVLGTHRQTRAGQLVGTPEFMAPEQIRGEEADGRADLYALGILLFRILSGRSPFHGPSEYEVMKAQIESHAPSLIRYCPALPPQLDPILARALAKRPEDRFPTAAAFREALEPLYEPATPTGPWTWPTRSSDAHDDLDEAPTSTTAATLSNPGPAGAEDTVECPARASDAPTGNHGPPRRQSFRHRAPWLGASAFAAATALSLDLVAVEPAVPEATTPPGLELRLEPLRTPHATAARSTPRTARAARFGTDPIPRLDSQTWATDGLPPSPTRAGRTPAATPRDPSAPETPAEEEGDRWVIRRH